MTAKRELKTYEVMAYYPITGAQVTETFLVSTMTPTHAKRLASEHRYVNGKWIQLENRNGEKMNAWRKVDKDSDVNTSSFISIVETDDKPFGYIGVHYNSFKREETPIDRLTQNL